MLALIDAQAAQDTNNPTAKTCLRVAVIAPLAFLFRRLSAAG
jgi:hypothetical protein